MKTDRRTAAQFELDDAYRNFLNELQEFFSSEGSEMSAGFWHTMILLQKKITDVWKSGACPEFIDDVSSENGMIF